MNSLSAKVRIGTANMLLADLEKHAAGVPIFDRIVDGKGSSLGSPAKYRENIEEVLSLPGIAQAAPAEYKALLVRWQALNAPQGHTEAPQAKRVIGGLANAVVVLPNQAVLF